MAGLLLVLADVAFVALVLWFRRKALDARPLWLYFGVVLAAHALWFTFAPTPAWHGFARWFRALPLTGGRLRANPETPALHRGRFLC